MAENKEKELVDIIVEGIEDVKGEDITIMDLRELDNAVCSYFVICNGNSNTQVNAIAGAIRKKTRENLGDRAWHVEGDTNSEWILMDYVTVVVHVFQKHIREFYNIEELWGDAKISHK